MSKSGYESMAKEDVAEFFSSCGDKFSELAALFDVVMQRVGEHNNTHALARLGKEVAFDYANMAGCWGEQIENGGIKP